MTVRAAVFGEVSFRAAFKQLAAELGFTVLKEEAEQFLLGKGAETTGGRLIDLLILQDPAGRAEPEYRRSMRALDHHHGIIIAYGENGLYRTVLRGSKRRVRWYTRKHSLFLLPHARSETHAQRLERICLAKVSKVLLSWTPV